MNGLRVDAALALCRSWLIRGIVGVPEACTAGTVHRAVATLVQRMGLQSPTAAASEPYSNESASLGESKRAVAEQVEPMPQPLRRGWTPRRAVRPPLDRTVPNPPHGPRSSPRPQRTDDALQWKTPHVTVTSSEQSTRPLSMRAHPLGTHKSVVRFRPITVCWALLPRVVRCTGSGISCATVCRCNTCGGSTAGQSRTTRGFVARTSKVGW